MNNASFESTLEINQVKREYFLQLQYLHHIIIYMNEHLREVFLMNVHCIWSLVKMYPSSSPVEVEMINARSLNEDKQDKTNLLYSRIDAIRITQMAASQSNLKVETL